MVLPLASYDMFVFEENIAGRIRRAFVRSTGHAKVHCKISPPPPSTLPRPSMVIIDSMYVVVVAAECLQTWGGLFSANQAVIEKNLLERISEKVP